MKTIIIGFVVAFALAASLVAQETAALSEIQQLKADNHKLKIVVAQLQAQVNECQLNGERAKLTEEFMKTLGAKPGEFFDWNTLTVKKEQK